MVDAFIDRGDARKGGRPAYPSEVMVHVLVLKRLYNLSGEQMEYQLLDRLSYQRFCPWQDSMNMPDRNTIWRFGVRIGVDGATALLQGVDEQLHRHGYIARGGQVIDVTLVSAPRQRIGLEDRQKLNEGESPDWSTAKASSKGRRCHAHQEARQELLWLQAQCESVDSKHGFIRGVATGTASEHQGHHFDEVLDTDHTGRQVRADKACSSRQRKDMLGVLGFKDEMQRKAETRQASERMPKATQSAHRQETRQGRTCMSLQPFGTWAVSSSARLDRPVRAPQ